MVTILIIDDQAEEDINFDAILTTNGFKVHIADGLENGISIAKRYLPGLIISNLKNESDGLSLIQILIRSEQTRTIPIIYLSESDDFRNQRAAMNCGADDYIVKPFETGVFIDAIKMRLKKHVSIKEQMMRICQESLEAENPQPKRDDHILVTIGKHLQLVKYREIVCITALKEYSKIRTFDGKSIIIRKSLKSWVDMLPAKGFLRIHRASIINVEAIEKIEKVKERTYVVYLKSLTEPLEFSQRYANIMRKTFPS